MRIVVDLPNSIARQAAQAVEIGEHASMDALVVEALSRLLGAEVPGATISIRGNEEPGGAAQSVGAVLGSSMAVGEYVHSDDPGAQWLWGMVNRVFPLKVGVRTCADMARRGPVLLQSLHATFADRGRKVGELLVASDLEQGRRRNEALAVGFPLSEDEQKARVRFAHQFIGRRSAAGTYVGGAFETGLVGVTEPGTDWVAPTELGWQFAALHNRVLDDGVAVGCNLEEPEQRFYLCEISPRVPAERNAYRAILGVLSNEPLDASALAARLLPFQNPDLPSALRDTSRSGALARLADVGGIKRIATGRSARYEITALGRNALERLSSAIPSA
jgi:hypothetical protein